MSSGFGTVERAGVEAADDDVNVGVVRVPVVYRAPDQLPTEVGTPSEFSKSSPITACDLQARRTSVRSRGRRVRPNQGFLAIHSFDRQLGCGSGKNRGR